VGKRGTYLAGLEVDDLAHAGGQEDVISIPSIPRTSTGHDASRMLDAPAGERRRRVAHGRRRRR
jgi:hypothetical protein